MSAATTNTVTNTVTNPVATKSGAPVLARCKGIDVNHDDGDIDWKKVLGAGIGFAFVKASEGSGFIDPKLNQNWAAMGAVGITRGVYHFLRPSQPAKAQAELLVGALKKAGGFLASDLPPVLDIEINGGVSRRQVVQAAHTWLEAVESATGRRPIVYVSPGFAVDYLDTSLGKYPLWVAHYTNKATPKIPAGWTNWDIWQYAPGEEGGHIVPGCPISVDVNWYNGSHTDMVKRFGLVAPVKQVKLADAIDAVGSAGELVAGYTENETLTG